PAGSSSHLHKRNNGTDQKRHRSEQRGPGYEAFGQEVEFGTHRTTLGARQRVPSQTTATTSSTTASAHIPAPRPRSPKPICCAPVQARENAAKTKAAEWIRVMACLQETQHSPQPARPAPAAAHAATPLRSSAPPAPE